jgi:hypothetical protein
VIDGPTFHADLVASNLRAIWANYLTLGVERAGGLVDLHRMKDCESSLVKRASASRSISSAATIGSVEDAGGSGSTPARRSPSRTVPWPVSLI